MEAGIFYFNKTCQLYNVTLVSDFKAYSVAVMATKNYICKAVVGGQRHVGIWPAGEGELLQRIADKISSHLF